MLSMSTDSFERYVQPHVKAIRRGRLVLFEVEELRRWCRDNAERVLPIRRRPCDLNCDQGYRRPALSNALRRLLSGIVGNS
jgi:hypothetical protein